MPDCTPTNNLVLGIFPSDLKSIYVHFNNGDGTFAAAVTHYSGPGPRSLTSGDANDEI
jgi:hypothetical protein